jgi:hypothetical protein
MFVLIVLATLVLFTVSALFKWQHWIRILINYMPIRGSSRIPRSWDVECGVERREDEEISTPSGPTFKSPYFEFNPWSIFGTLKGSVYSPLSSRDGIHQDPGGQYYGHTALLRNPQSITFDQTQVSLAEPHFSQRLTQRSLFRPFANVNNMLKRLLRPLPDAEKQRIQWICVSHPYSLLLSFYLLILPSRDVVMNCTQIYRVVHVRKLPGSLQYYNMLVIQRLPLTDPTV